MIGLEIKQEVLIGELSSVRKAILPVIAACGGMIVPVLFFLLVCNTGPEARGAAIPMATDIAFALAVLGLLGKRVPLSMRIFLTALAVVDDIGGIIIIALFYSGHIAYQPLLISLALLALLYAGGKMRVNNNLFYYIVGFFVWILFLESGIHPTIAGVLVAFTVPARPKLTLNAFSLPGIVCRKDIGYFLFYLFLCPYKPCLYAGRNDTLESVWGVDVRRYWFHSCTVHR